jgi:hypothetical protein
VRLPDLAVTPGREEREALPKLGLGDDAAIGRAVERGGGDA